MLGATWYDTAFALEEEILHQTVLVPDRMKRVILHTSRQVGPLTARAYGFLIPRKAEPTNLGPPESTMRGIWMNDAKLLRALVECIILIRKSQG